MMVNDAPSLTELDIAIVTLAALERAVGRWELGLHPSFQGRVVTADWNDILVPFAN